MTRIILAVIFVLVVVALIFDTMLSNLSGLFSQQSSFSNWEIVFFIVLSSMCMGAQYFILGFVKQKIKVHKINEKHVLNLKVMYKIVSIAQYVLTVNLGLVILQIIVRSQYSVAMLISATIISYGLSISMLALLAQRFFLWFKSNKDSVVLLYGLSSAALSITEGLITVLICSELLNKPAEISSTIKVIFPAFGPTSAMGMLTEAYTVFSIVSFILTWLATATLLHHYSQRLGWTKYWIIISIPLVYFLGQFLTVYPSLFLPLFHTLNPILSITIFTLNSTAGGFLFGIAFWNIAKSIHNSVVRDYMIISAYGFVLFFISDQASIVQSPYPPFGIATASYTGLASYLILVGLYSSAISVSQDIRLRHSIRKSAIEESKLLDRIGSAHMEQELQNRVINIANKHSDKMAEESGVEPSLTKEEMKDYLDKIINEINKNKK